VIRDERGGRRKGTEQVLVVALCCLLILVKESFIFCSVMCREAFDLSLELAGSAFICRYAVRLLVFSYFVFSVWRGIEWYLGETVVDRM